MIATIENTLTPDALSPELPALPPSARDLELYEYVTVECRTTRDAAAKFGISQTRVRQVLSRVVEFLVEAVPINEDDDDRKKKQKLAAAQGLARQRLDYVYGQAMHMWRKSMTPTISSPVALGKVCYLNQAMRVALAAAKVPIQPWPVCEEVEPETEEATTAAAPEHPPVKGCSENEASREALSAEQEATPVANDEANKTYRTLDEIKAAMRSTVPRPAQTELEQPLTLPERGARQNESLAGLSRRERRKRQRILARLERRQAG